MIYLAAYLWLVGAGVLWSVSKFRTPIIPTLLWPLSAPIIILANISDEWERK